MALPLPSVVANVGPGGGLVTALQGLNALNQSNIKTQYMPLLSQADAASKLAYANLMGPQFLAKLMGHSDIVANSPQLQNPSTIQTLYNAGIGQGTGNALLSSPALLAKNNQSPLSKIVNSVKSAFGFGSPNSQTAPSNALLQNQPVVQNTEQATSPTNINTPASIQDNSTYNPTTVSAPSSDTYAENAARYKSIQKAGEELGTARGKAISDLGEQQLALSASGASLDRLTDIIQNPAFQSMRDQIPFYQDKQLNVLSKIGNKAQQDLIGDFISTAQAFKASTINSFKGKALEKEFNLADKIKIDENDTIGTATGKLRSLKTLKDIAETKNDMIIDLMTNKNMNEGDAVRQANKLISTKNIEKQVDTILNPPVTIMYKNNQKYNIPNDKVEAAKKAGYTNG